MSVEHELFLMGVCWRQFEGDAGDRFVSFNNQTYTVSSSGVGERNCEKTNHTTKTTFFFFFF